MTEGTLMLVSTFATGGVAATITAIHATIKHQLSKRREDS